MIEEYGSSIIDTEDTLVTSARHFESLGNALDSLYATRNSLLQGLPTDLLAEDLRQSIASLNEIFSLSLDTESILSNIFQHFCIGNRD